MAHVSGALKLEGNRKWIMLLVMCTGARLGELVRLRVEDIKLDDRSARYYITISPEAGDAKTKAAFRKIPLHKKMVELGFLDMVANVGRGRLWPEVKEASITQYFTKFREFTGVEYKCELGNKRVFHSFRHWVVTKAMSKGVREVVVQQVVGHESGRGWELLKLIRMHFLLRICYLRLIA